MRIWNIKTSKFAKTAKVGTVGRGVYSLKACNSRRLRLTELITGVRTCTRDMRVEAEVQPPSQDAFGASVLAL